MAEFELFVSKSDFKFSCAHFIVHEHTRERLHGHNYQLSIRIVGGDALCSDGYLMDFGEVKQVARRLCKEINESFICPAKSPYMRINQIDGSICMECVDGKELAHYFWFTLIERLGVEELNLKGVKVLEIGVEETHNQRASYRRAIPSSVDELALVKNSPVRNPPQLCFQSQENRGY